MSMEPLTFTGNSNGVNHPIDRSQRNRSLRSLSSLRLSSVEKISKTWHSTSLYRDRWSLRMGKNRHLPTSLVAGTRSFEEWYPRPRNFHRDYCGNLDGFGGRGILADYLGIFQAHRVDQVRAVAAGCRHHGQCWRTRGLGSPNL